MPGHGQTVAVFGASGHTGKFVVGELLRRELEPIAIGRDRERLARSNFEERGALIRTASIDDPPSLNRALTGAAAVINCAGPFLDTADAVAAAALRARAHYFDVTAEQGSALATFDRFGNAARKAGVVAVPAMSFFGGLGDLLATAAMRDWKTADAIGVGIALNSWHPTQGTRITGKRNTARRLVIVNRELTPQTLPASETSWNFPEPFGRQDVTEVPFSEVVLIARHLRVLELHTYLNNTPLRDLRDTKTPPPTAADETGRSAQTFAVEVIVQKGDKTRRAHVLGRDIYAFTAVFVVEAAMRVLGGKAEGRGAFAPGELFGARDFLQALAPEHLAFEIRSE